MTRGISIKVGSGSDTAIPVSDVTHNPQNNLIVEKSFGLSTETAIYGGGRLYTGTFGGAYRPYLYQNVLKGFMGGTLTSVDLFSAAQYATITIGDGDTTMQYSSCAITSFELNFAAGNFAKVTCNWTGIFATTSGTLTTDDTIYQKLIPVFYNTEIAGMKVKTMKLTLSRPFDQSNFIIGSEYMQEMVQNDNVGISGSFTVSPKDYDLFKKLMMSGDTLTSTPSTTNKNTVLTDGTTITLRSPDGTQTLQTITMTKLALSDGTASASGMNPFDKTINFRVPVDNSTYLMSFSTPINA